MSQKNTIRVTQVRSTAGRLPKHKACISGLGLGRIGDSRELEDTPAVRGMIDKVRYLLAVEGLTSINGERST